MSSITIQQITTGRDLRAFVTFPWRVYKGDPCWVPPLISDQIAYLTPEKNPFFENAEAALFVARRGSDIVGTIAPCVNRHDQRSMDEKAGVFGFFEVLDDGDAAKALLDVACGWLQERGLASMRGPYNFTEHDRPGILVEGRTCPPVVLAAHTPAYYNDLLEQCGMEKHSDSYCWRAVREQIGEELQNLPAEILRVGEAARQSSGATIRKVRLDHWDEDVAIAGELFNATLSQYRNHRPMTEEAFRRFADSFRSLIDPDLALIAEVDGKPVGFSVAIPDPNRVLIHLNGRLYPFGWAKTLWYLRRIDVVTFKLMGVLPEYRRRGIDAMMYLDMLRAVFQKGYKWLDGSITAETNLLVNLLAGRLGADRYKQYRVYQKVW
jgi:GNAT superfamily N-acetyltransferase